MKTREERFFGDGNCSVEDGDGKRKRAWSVRCRSCAKDETVRISKALPPDVVIKKFRQKGWIVGVKPEDDLCGQCRDASNIPAAPAAASAEQELERLRGRYGLLSANLSKLSSERVQLMADKDELRQENDALYKEMDQAQELNDQNQSLVRSLHELLLNDLVDEALQKIEAAYPKWPWARRPQKLKGSVRVAPLKQADPDFDKWLSDLERQRTKGNGASA